MINWDKIRRKKVNQIPEAQARNLFNTPVLGGLSKLLGSVGSFDHLSDFQKIQNDESRQLLDAQIFRQSCPRSIALAKSQAYGELKYYYTNITSGYRKAQTDNLTDDQLKYIV